MEKTGNRYVEVETPLDDEMEEFKTLGERMAVSPLYFIGRLDILIDKLEILEMNQVLLKEKIAENTWRIEFLESVQINRLGRHYEKVVRCAD